MGGLLIKAWNTPIFNAINGYVESETIPFHMPGHKLGKGLPREFFSGAALMDLTEIPGTDDLHCPRGAIKDAQEFAAKAFGAKKSYFLVNGSTCGIHSAILTVCKPGDKLLVARDCHKSIISGMILAGAIPVYIKPRFEDEFSISGAISIENLEKALTENRDVVGVIITRPNYYGICSDIEGIARLIHSYKKILIVDEAHGAHLCFNNKLPIPALAAGADISVQSAHKTLPAFTQGAYLHVNSQYIDSDKLEFYLSMIQTSSPSYILMAYLDIARAIMENDGERMLDNALAYTSWFRNSINFEWNPSVLSEDRLGSGVLDNTRLVINTKRLGKTGYEVEKILREEYNIQVEMSDTFNIVCIVTVADTKEDLQALSRAMNHIWSKYKGAEILNDIAVKDLKLPRQALGLNEIRACDSLSLDINKALGKIGMCMVTPYPPGIPVICPGEIVTAEAVEYIGRIVALGGKVTGLDKEGRIKVLR